ncbi:MAG: beta strand repeat-containing protein [Phycisphaerales bacterium]
MTRTTPPIDAHHPDLPAHGDAMPRPSPALLIAIAGAPALLALASPPAAAQTWINPAGGPWSLPFNWSPALVPNAPGATATIGLPGVYDIDITTNITLGTLNCTGGDARININPGAQLTLNAGSHQVNGILSIGNFSPSGSNAILNIAADAVLKGTGITRLDDNDTPNDAQIISTNGATLTIDPAHSIGGGGLLSAKTNNLGAIVADSPDIPLVLDTAAKINEGSIIAKGSGFLNINSIIIDQTAGGELFIDGPNALVGLSGSGTTIVGGSLNASTNAQPYLLDPGDATLDGVALNAALRIKPGGTLNIVGGQLANNGIIQIGNFISGGSNSVLNFAEPTLLTGGGLIELLDNNGDDAQLNGTLTQAAGHTIAGTGQLNAALTNDGLVVANFGTATERPLVLRGEDKINNSLITASPGIIDIESITIDQTGGGILRAENQIGQIRFVGGSNSTIIAGTIESLSGLPVLRQPGTTTLNNVTIEGDALLIEPGGTINITGGALENNAAILVGQFFPSTSNSILNFAEPTTLHGDGAILLLDNNSDDAQLNGVVTQTAQHNIGGTGNINAKLTNNAQVLATETGLPLRLLAQDKTNNNLIGATNGAILEIGAITINQSAAATIYAEEPGSLVRFLSGTNSTINAGTLSTFDDAEPMLREPGLTTLNNVIIEADIDIEDGGTIAIANQQLINNGTIRVGKPSPSLATATLQFLTPSADITGPGAIILSTPGTAGAVVDAASLEIGPDHTIAGAGVITGNLINSGTVNPGTPDTVMKILGNYTEMPGSALALTIFDEDQLPPLAVTGAATLAADIHLTLSPPLTPTIGQSFTIITANNGATGTMNIASAPEIAGLRFTAITDANAVRIIVSACADLNDDGAVNSDDLGILLSAFALSGAGDVDGDGDTDSDDLGILLSQFGSACD